MPDWAIVVFIAVAALILVLVIRALIRLGDRR
jgi:energy-converting hydrogenase Eha subunit E